MARYKYTCPDVIHMQKVQRTQNLIVFITLKLDFLGILAASARAAARKPTIVTNISETPASS